MHKKITHLMYVPFTGLGLYNGFRGDRWLRNRITVFNKFIVPSLKAQTNQNFIIWISWRREERNNPLVLQLKDILTVRFGEERVVFTFSGVCFYDDKYPDEMARDRLLTAVHQSLPTLFDYIAESDHILMTIQPSDDCYNKNAVEVIQNVLRDDKYDAVGFQKGYICNYNTREVSEYNPTTNPPFYTIKFPYNTFTDPLAHAQFTALKKDSGKYKAGTPLPSHEYVGECLRYACIADVRGFLVGTHGENISTTYVHPFKGELVNNSILEEFGIISTSPLKLKISIRKKILKQLPFPVQKKLRFWFGEKLWNMCYNFLRS